MTDCADLTATEALARVARGELAPDAMLSACRARIAAREAEVQAFACLGELDGFGPGPLAGMPVGVKDVLDTADLPSGYGSPIWAGHRPRADAACVAWVRAAGGVVVGKTVTTEFATRRPGPTTNPHDPRRTPGGSSSGSAAGVAAGFFPFAFGTQTAGSVIRPAAYCGVVGYKPSYGLIPRLGMKVMSDSLDTIGVFARSVADAALLAGVAARRALGPAIPGGAPRIGLCRTDAWDQAAPETATLLEGAAAHLAEAGADLVRFDLPPAFDALAHAQSVVMNAESGRSMGWELATAREAISDGLLERLEWGLARGDAELAQAQATFLACQAAFAPALGELDLLLTPAAPGEAPGRHRMDRRPGVQRPLDRAARPLRHAPGRTRSECDAARRPARRPARRGRGVAGLGRLGGTSARRRAVSAVSTRRRARRTSARGPLRA